MEPRMLAAGLGIAGMAVSASAALAEFPEDTIHIVVPYPAGGGTDSIGRGLAKTD